MSANAPEVLFFDVNETLLNLENLRSSVGRVLGDRQEAVKLWFTTLLQYSLIDTVSSQYHAFDEIGAAALQMVAGNFNIKLAKEEAKKAIMPIRSLPPHPEVPEALKNLREAGYRMIPLTNSSKNALYDQMANSGLADFFEQQWSVEEVGLYKPHSKVYQWAVRQAGAEAKNCMLIAAHGWDITGSLRAGMRAAFIHRPGQQLYPLAPEPEFSAPDLSGIAEYLIKLKR